MKKINLKNYLIMCVSLSMAIACSKKQDTPVQTPYYPQNNFSTQGIANTNLNAPSVEAFKRYKRSLIKSCSVGRAFNILKNPSKQTKSLDISIFKPLMTELDGTWINDFSLKYQNKLIVFRPGFSGLEKSTTIRETYLVNGKRYSSKFKKGICKIKVNGKTVHQTKLVGALPVIMAMDLDHPQLESLNTFLNPRIIKDEKVLDESFNFIDIPNLVSIEQGSPIARRRRSFRSDRNRFYIGKDCRTLNAQFVLLQDDLRFDANTKSTCRSTKYSMLRPYVTQDVFHIVLKEYKQREKVKKYLIRLKL